MKELVILSKNQFGYHTDVQKWCQYLSSDYNVCVVCYDQQRPKIAFPGVKVCYAPILFGVRRLRPLFFLLISLYQSFVVKGPIMIEYFKGCPVLVKILWWKRFILDIRTLSVAQNERDRLKENLHIRNECLNFKEVSVISTGIGKQLSLPQDIKVHLLPLGADTVSTSTKIFDKLRLLYVGTLSNRDIHKTIYGLQKFLYSNESSIDVEYHIIGDGNDEDVSLVKKAINDCAISSKVFLHGFIHHDELKSYFDLCNIGVSFIPITPCYEDQPPTKTFEYILSGLFTIATATRSNIELISKDNGFLIKDNSDDFCEALNYIKDNISRINSTYINKSLIQYQWNKIVDDFLKPILNNK